MAQRCVLADGLEENGCFRPTCSAFCLPTELLLHIFRLAINSDIDPHGFPFPARTTAPLLLTWVCHPWRQLAISSPELWTSISLGSSGSSLASRECILDLFVSRSGDESPLSFALNYDQPDASHPQKLSLCKTQSKSYVSSMRVIARRLVAVRHRWRHLIVNALVLDALAPFLRALSQGTPLLETLSVSTKYTGFHGPEFTLSLTSCTHLQTVRILSPRVFFDPSLPLLRNLTSLDLHYVHSQLDAVSWLAACPNLERLSVELYASSRRNEPPSTLHIRKARLSHFSLTCFYGESDPGPLLDVLIVPSLHSFHFNRNGLSLLGPDRSSRNIIDLFERSEDPPLRELHLVDTPENPDELAIVLRCAGHVKHLVLGGEAVTDELLRQMRGASAGERLGGYTSPLCPELETLEIHDVPASFPSIVAFACSRSQAPEESPTSSEDFKTLKVLILSSDIFSLYFEDPSVHAAFPSGLSMSLT